MAFKTRRQKRYESLRKTGFAKFEAQALSKVPFAVPYMKDLIKSRLKEYKVAFKENWTLKRWEGTIKDKYQEGKWLDSKGRLSAWSMLRDYESQYRAKHPQYDSPWKKKRKDFRDFISTFEKKIADLPPPEAWSQATWDRDTAQRQEREEHFKRMRDRE